MTKNLLQLLKNIKYTKRTHCVVCGKKSGPPVIDLPRFPLTEIYTKSLIREQIGFADQEFYLCRFCGHGQIGHVLDQEVLYLDTYHFRTSHSRTASSAIDYFVAFVEEITGDTCFDNVVDIGCNDLYLLKAFKDKAKKLIGIDPVLSKLKNNSPGEQFELIGDFIENVDLKSRLRGKKNLILSSHTLEHLPDPLALLNRLMAESSPETLFCFQFPGLEPLVDDFRFDQIFHHHLNYFSLQSIEHMLGRLGARLIKFRTNLQHWGSYLIAFQKKAGTKNNGGNTHGIAPKEIEQGYQLFGHQMKTVGAKLKGIKEKNIYGYGAALMLPVLNYHLNDHLSRLKYVIDDDPQKRGYRYINFPVSIRLLKDIPDIRQATLVLTAVATVGNIRTILQKMFALQPRQIIVPIPVI